MIAVTGGFCYPSPGGKYTGRVKNPRVVRANYIKKEDGGSLMGWQNALGVMIMLNATCG